MSVGGGGGGNVDHTLVNVRNQAQWVVGDKGRTSSFSFGQKEFNQSRLITQSLESELQSTKIIVNHLIVKHTKCNKSNLSNASSTQLLLKIMSLSILDILLNIFKLLIYFYTEKLGILLLGFKTSVQHTGINRKLERQNNNKLIHGSMRPSLFYGTLINKQTN